MWARKSLAAALFLFLIAGTSSASTVWRGSDPIARSTHDGATQITFFDVTPGHEIPFAGILEQWEVYAATAGPVKLQVFESAGQNYKLIGQTQAELQPGLNTIPANIPVSPGQVLGFRYGDTPGYISYDYSLPELMAYTWWPATATDIDVGDSVEPTLQENRAYSLRAQITGSAVPTPTALSAGLALLGAVLLPALRKRRRA